MRQGSLRHLVRMIRFSGCQSRKLDRKPCGTAATFNPLSSSDSVVFANGLVMGEGEGSGGGDGGARGALSPVGGSKGPEPLASPNVLHWVGWLSFITRCGTGPAVPVSHAAPPRRTLPVSRRVPAPAEHLSRYRNRAGIRSLLFRGTRPHGGSRSRTAGSPRNLLLSSKALEATAMVSSLDRLNQGPGSGQAADSADTYGRHRMPVDRMGRPWKHRRPEDGCPRLNHRTKAHVVPTAVSRALAPLGVEGRLAETEW